LVESRRIKVKGPLLVGAGPKKSCFYPYWIMVYWTLRKKELKVFIRQINMLKKYIYLWGIEGQDVNRNSSFLLQLNILQL